MVVLSKRNLGLATSGRGFTHHGGGPFVRLVNTRRLLELGKVEPGREHTHALPAA